MSCSLSNIRGLKDKLMPGLTDIGVAQPAMARRVDRGFCSCSLKKWDTNGAGYVAAQFSTRWLESCSFQAQNGYLMPNLLLVLKPVTWTKCSLLWTLTCGNLFSCLHFALQRLRSSNKIPSSHWTLKSSCKQRKSRWIRLLTTQNNFLWLRSYIWDWLEKQMWQRLEQ